MSAPALLACLAAAALASAMEGPAVKQFEHVVIDAEGPKDPHVKAAGDLDADGVPDLVVASSAGGPLVWYRSPDWKRRVIAPSGSWSCDAKVVDMDGDGDADVVISEWYGQNRMEWYENPGAAALGDRPWTRRVIGTGRAHDIAIADLDGDGRLEIVTRDQDALGDHVTVWRRTGRESWSNSTFGCPAGEGLALGDLNADGRLEIVIGGRWYEPPGDASGDHWRERVFAEWSPDAVVKVADMNGDGRPDVVLSRPGGHLRLSWFEAPADPARGVWTEHVVDDSVDFVHGLAVTDMDGDGRPDIVAAEMHQSPRQRVMVYWNRGDERWERQVLATTGSHNICVADFGGPGRPAVAGANWSGPYQPVEVWLPVSRTR